MPRTEPFQEHTDRYEAWFETFEAAYDSEIDALRSLRPSGGHGLEIGVGTGRFASRLDFEHGVDPASEMLRRARNRGLSVTRGVAEALPYRDGSFATGLIVTTICFVDDLDRSLREAARVLRPRGHLLLGYIDKESPVGRLYQEQQAESPFYRDATFKSTTEVLDALEAAGFVDMRVRQTLFEMPDEMEGPDPVRDGYGDGSFVAIRATNKSRQ